VFSSQNSAAWKMLDNFRSVISKNQIWRPKDDVQFVFLCGANIGKRIPSKRRQSLLSFSDRNLPNSKFFLAESIFDVLQAEGNKTNLLDIENDLSKFADFVIIVLESESAFCELGAFATHTELRKKLIVINDSKYSLSESFINLGPIQSLKEISGELVLDYKMEPNGKIYGDAIGGIYSKLHKIIHKDAEYRRKRVEAYDPSKYFTKESLRFLHDLIFFTNPISLIELVRVSRILFSTSNQKLLEKHLALLCATKQIERKERKHVGLYVSLLKRPFFEYGLFDVGNLIAAFKNLYFRYDHQRFQCK